MFNALKDERNDSDSDEEVSLPIYASKGTLKIIETHGSLFSSKGGQIRQVVIDALASCSSISDGALNRIVKRLGKLFKSDISICIHEIKNSNDFSVSYEDNFIHL